MTSNKKLYWILLSLSLAGYCWVGFHWLQTDHAEESTVCIFKQITGIPCPSCGTTRSVLALLQGNYQEAFFINPLGFLAVLLLLVIPCWISLDILLKTESLLRIYLHAEQQIKTKKLIYIPMILLIAGNWVWNISKGL